MCGILDISWALLYVISNHRPLGVGVSEALELALLGSDHWIFAEKKAMVALQECMWGFMVGFFFFFWGGWFLVFGCVAGKVEKGKSMEIIFSMGGDVLQRRFLRWFLVFGCVAGLG